MGIDALATRIQSEAETLKLPPRGALSILPVGRAERSLLPAHIAVAGLKRQDTFASGRRAALSALSAAGASDRNLAGIDADRLPIWPTGWLGSISHTNDLAAAIVAPVYPHGNTRVLGLDLEKILAPTIASDIFKEVLPEWVGRDHLGISLTAISLGFSAKEALFKALFPSTRRFRDFSAARITTQNVGFGCGSTTMALTETWGPNFRVGSVFVVDHIFVEDHVLSMIWQ